MKFTVTTKDLVPAITKVLSITGNSIVTLTAKGKTVRVASQGKANMLAIKVPATVEKDGSMSIEGFMLAQTIKPRAEATIAVSDSQCVITAKSLNHRLVTVPAEDVQAVNKKDGQAIAAEVHEAFTKAMSSASISNVHDDNPIVFRVKLNKKGLSVVAADSHHMASVHNSNIKSKAEVSFTIAADAFSTISGLAGKEPFELSFTDSEVLAWNTSFEVRIPTLAESTSGPDEQAVTSMIETLRANKATVKAVVSRSEFFSVLESLQGIFEAGANVKLTTTDKGLQLKFATSYGESKGLVKTTGAKGKFAHQVDLPLVRDTFSLSDSKELELRVLGEAALYSIIEAEGIEYIQLVTMVTA